jgi:hypothetical protein
VDGDPGAVLAGNQNPGFKVIPSEDKNITLIQQNISNALQPITSSQLLTGSAVLVDFTKVPINTDVLIQHNLGTTKVAWLEGTKTAGGIPYLSPNNINLGSNPAPTRQILLRSTAQMKCVLWFFQGSSIPGA